jgi:mannose-1-phosphate guanylyltransferase
MTIKALLLAAGKGERLKPFTNIWPKCLMPISGEPLLSIWINILLNNHIDNILINTSYLKEKTESFLQRPVYMKKIHAFYEENLLGTAGTIKANYNFLKNNTTLLIHADNLCITDFSAFIDSHSKRPKNCLITMMTFKSHDPRSCGIVVTDKDNIVTEFYEKVDKPPSNIANAAVYLVEPEVINWINEENYIFDFSKDVIPHFLNKIYCWHNQQEHIDIGTPENFRRAQNIVIPPKYKGIIDDWTKLFKNHPIHDLINEYYKV